MLHKIRTCCVMLGAVLVLAVTGLATTSASSALAGSCHPATDMTPYNPSPGYPYYRVNTRGKACADMMSGAAGWEKYYDDGYNAWFRHP